MYEIVVDFLAISSVATWPQRGRPVSKVVEPKVYMIGYPGMENHEASEYLEVIGAGEWESSAMSDSLELLEMAGRICYRSFGTELNKNLTRVREDNSEYLRNIIQSGHGRILEHVNVNFIFHDISRVLTLELITHKVGTTQSQESLRFVRLDELRVYLPDIFKQYGFEAYFLEKMAILESWQAEMSAMFDLDNKTFAEKKIITSAMRRLAPMGLCTTVMWTANLRTIRHVLEQRTSVHAEEEIRKLFQRVGNLMQLHFHEVFSDFTEDPQGQWIPQHSKV
jgi:thymidylate synthase (FAD)